MCLALWHPVTKALQKFMSYFKAKHSSLLGGALCLIPCLYMMRSSNKPFRQLAPCYQNFQRGMLKHLLHIGMFFKRMLSMYGIQDDGIDSVVSQSQLLTAAQVSQLHMQLPVLELLKFHITWGHQQHIREYLFGFKRFHEWQDRFPKYYGHPYARSRIHGQLVEKAVRFSLEIIMLILQKDLLVSDYWRPLYQPLDVILSQDHNQIIALLEYVRYEFLPQIQQCSIKIMSIISSHMS